MAPKRKRAVSGRRLAANESSFCDCPACEMKVASYLINDHLDWDCPALTRSKVQPPTTSAAKATEQLVKSPEELLCTSQQARAHDSLLVLDTERELHSSPVQDTRMRLHKRLHIEETGSELGVYCYGDKLDTVVEEGLNISHLETDSHELWKGSSIGEGDQLDQHDKNFDAREQCVEIHNGFLKQTDEFNSHAHLSFVESPGRGYPSTEASTSSSKGAKGDGWRLITTSSPPRAPKGHYVFENFISETEERDILLFLDTDLRNPWKSTTFNGLQTGKDYGLSTDLRKRCARPVIFEMPKVLRPIIERMRTTVPVLKDFWPNGTNAIDYQKHKGHWLKAHVDDRQLSGTIVVNLSLCGDCKMTYERERGPRESYKVLLRRRCIQVLTGESRYNFTHSIHNDDLLDPRRVSMTFRQSVDA